MIVVTGGDFSRFIPCPMIIVTGDDLGNFNPMIIVAGDDSGIAP